MRLPTRIWKTYLPRFKKLTYHAFKNEFTYHDLKKKTFPTKISKINLPTKMNLPTIFKKITYLPRFEKRT